MEGSNPSLLGEKLWVSVLSWLRVTTRAGGRDCVSASPTLFDVVSLSLPWCAGFAQLVFRVFSRGNCSICSCRFSVSLGGGELRIFLRHHLEVEPSPTHALLDTPSLPDSNTWDVHPTPYSPQCSIILTYFLFEAFPTFSGQWPLASTLS